MPGPDTVSLPPPRPPRPPLVFHVGVTGHRALPDADPAALGQAAAGLFRRLREGIGRLHDADAAAPKPLYGPGPPVLRCICGIAEGADSILAEAALAEGWELAAVLPFARDEFSRDFPAGTALDRYRTLLARAASVCELDGSRQRGGEPYDATGRQIVERADLLLAIWDGLPPRGPGGTGDVVRQAASQGLPVAVLPATGPATVSWHDSGSSAGPDDLDAVLASILLPPPDPHGFPQSYYDDKPRPSRWAASALQGFERTLLLGAKTAPTVPTGGAPAAAVPAIAPYFHPADRLATIYAARFRAAGLLRYGFVLPATVGSFMTSFGPDWLRPAGYALQFGSLFAVLWFSARGGWRRAQIRFIAYRALAEFLRNAQLLAPLAAGIAPPGAASHGARASDWTAWYARAVLRGAAPPDGRLDAAAVAAATASLRAQTLDEIAYLRTRAARYAVIARRLKRIGMALTVCGIALNIGHAALVVGRARERPVLWSSELALVLPALAPVFLGLLGFGEYERLSTRYAAVAAELTGHLAALDRAGAGRNAVLDVARRIAGVLLAETADWQLLIRARSLPAL